jgi:hypothetical protein
MVFKAVSKVILFSSLLGSGYAHASAVYLRSDFKVSEIKNKPTLKSESYVFPGIRPNTYGIEIQDGLSNAVQGKRCLLESGKKPSSFESLTRDDQYAIQETATYNQKSRMLTIRAFFTYRSSGEILISCRIRPSEVAGVTVGQIENDLGRSIRFFHRQEANPAKYIYSLQWLHDLSSWGYEAWYGEPPGHGNPNLED